MQIRQCVLFAAALLTASCGAVHVVSSESQSLTAAQFASVSKGARAFALEVASDVTREGPAAWRRHFSEGPSFFMASAGHMVYPDRAAAGAGIEELSRTTAQIDLKWGGDLRVDPLAPDLALLAASYRETRVSKAGEREEESGFFTGVAEEQEGRWRFRDAHWSVAAPAKSTERLQ